VPGDIPYSDPRPCPTARLSPPFETPVAKLARLAELDHLAMRALAVTPDDFGEAKRHRPERANLRHDLGGRRRGQVHLRQEHFAGGGKELAFRQRRERIAPSIERRKSIELDVVD